MVLASLGLPCAAQPADPDGVLDVEQAYQTTARQSQQRIEALDDATVAMLSEYNAEVERHEDLITYNANLRALLSSQAAEKQRLTAEIAEIEVIRREIVPLMVQMLDVLGRYIELDVPLLLDERRARAEALRDILTRSDVDLAEKYRRLIEAYHIEAEYGQSIEAYEGPISLDGREVTVDFLRLGRAGLFYLSLDRDEGGIWDPRTRRWEPLADAHLNDLDYAVRMARKQVPPNLLRLPLWTDGSRP